MKKFFSRVSTSKAGPSGYNWGISPNDNSDGVPDNILAFRTITTLLHKIQKDRPLTITDGWDNQTLHHQEKKILQISHAFANLAVMHHEKLALTTNLSVDGLQVIVCINYDHNNQLIHQSSTSKFAKVLRMVFSRNYRSEGELSNYPNLAILDSKIPSVVEPNNSETLIHHIYHNCYRDPPSLREHLWIVSKLLVMKPYTIVPFLDYIIIVCYPKMARRFADPRSGFYHTSLKEVKMENITFSESESQITWGDEKIFRNFLETARGEKRLVSTNIPNILKQVNLMFTEKHENVYLYTKDTYQEFHRLFLDVLDRFREGLLGLMTHDHAKFKENLKLVQLSGLGLQCLTRSAVFETHLKTIESSLEQYHLDTAPESMPEGVEPDEDLEAVQPSASIKRAATDLPHHLPLHALYKEWLKLMLLFFDAVDVLDIFVDKKGIPFNTIDIKLLVTPPVSQDLLPWEELFKSNFISIDGPEEELSYNNDSILKFLQTNSTLNFGDALVYVNKIKTDYTSGNISNLKNSVNRLKTSKNQLPPGWKKWAEDLHLKLETLDQTLTQSAWVGEDIESLISSHTHLKKFFTFLHQLKSSQFSGKLHCEAILATLLKLAKDGIDDDSVNGEYGDILAELKNYGQIIGVSKCCCPACRRLLFHLANNGQPYHVIGSHSTVYPCTLPSWLPEDIVNSMNNYFGGQLRKEIIKLMNHFIIPSRIRTSSSESRRISTDSAQVLQEGGTLQML